MAQENIIIVYAAYFLSAISFSIFSACLIQLIFRPKESQKSTHSIALALLVSLLLIVTTVEILIIRIAVGYVILAGTIITLAKEIRKKSETTREEPPKDREIQRIERKLEKLYYPLRGQLQQSFPILNFGTSESPLEHYRKFQYLASDDLMKAMNDYYGTYHSNFDAAVVEKRIKDIKEIVEREIPNLEKKLRELSG